MVNGYGYHLPDRITKPAKIVQTPTAGVLFLWVCRDSRVSGARGAAPCCGKAANVGQRGKQAAFSLCRQALGRAHAPVRVYKCALSEFWDRAHYPRYSTIRGNFQIVAIYKDFKEISSDNVTTILESPATDSPFSVLQNFPFAGRTISRSNPGYACSQSPVKAQRTVRS